MTRELQALVADAQQREADIRSADTPENEARLLGWLQSKGITVRATASRDPPLPVPRVGTSHNRHLKGSFESRFR